MQVPDLSRLSDDDLLHAVTLIVSRNRRITAILLAYLGEVDARRLYVAAGHSSMHAYCVDALRLSDDAAYKRIQAARAARRFPSLLDAVEDGRLHLTAVRLLAPHVAADNVDELVAAATHQQRATIEEFLARRFPATEPVRIPTRLKALPAGPETREAGSPVPSLLDPTPFTVELPELSEPTAQDHQLAPGQVEPAPRMEPQSRYLLQVAIDKATHDKLRRAQALLAHSVPAGDVAAVLDRALEALLRQCEKRKLARLETTPRKPRTPRPALPGTRTIPAHVRRAVWARDEGRCTFTSTGGQRCNATHLLEFDHVVPMALGGVATVEGTRLRCHAHNQLEAERVFGTAFMEGKRSAAMTAGRPPTGG